MKMYKGHQSLYNQDVDNQKIGKKQTADTLLRTYGKIVFINKSNKQMNYQKNTWATWKLVSIREVKHISLTTSEFLLSEDFSITINLTIRKLIAEIR